MDKRNKLRFRYRWKHKQRIRIEVRAIILPDLTGALIRRYPVPSSLGCLSTSRMAVRVCGEFAAETFTRPLPEAV